MAAHGGLLRLVWCLSIIALSVCSPPPADATEIKQERNYAPGEVIIKYRERGAVGGTGDKVPVCGAKSFRKINRFGIEHLKLPASMTTEQAIEELSKDPNIEYVEPNYLVTLSVLPNDIHFDKQWALRNTGQLVNGSTGTSGADIKAHQGWDKETGDASVVVAVIDTGIDWRHPDLAANIWINPGEVPENGIDDDSNGKVDDVMGWDFVHGDNDPTDPHGHGTHVAGTIGASGGNGIGVAGVAWNVRLMPLRAFSANGIGYTSDILSAIDYAIGNNARIINASYGKSSYSQSEFDAMALAQEAGLLFVAAAGNQSANADLSPQYPAAYRASRMEGDVRVLMNIISVAATDHRDLLAGFSNYGPESVDVAAPGWFVYNTSPKPLELFRAPFPAGDTAGWILDSPWGVTSDPEATGFWLTDSPEGAYQNNLNVSATSPAIDVHGKSGLVLGFRLRGRTEPGFDRMHVEVLSDGRWNSLPVMVGNELFLNGIWGVFNAWTPVKADLGIVDALQDLTYRFRLVTDSSVTDDGYSIDGITVSANDDYAAGGEEYRHLSGTSMASPHVAGLAALLWSQDPSRDYLAVKRAIFDQVDILPSLSGKVLTGGRINVDKSLSAALPTRSGPGDHDEAAEMKTGGGGGGGCVYDASASFGLEWLILAVVVVAWRRSFSVFSG